MIDTIVGALLGSVRRVERYLGPEDDWVEDDRRAVFEAAQWLLGDLHTFIYRKGTNDYETTVDATPDEVEEVLHPKYQRNLASTRKYRQTDGGKQWAVGSFVHDPSDEPWQHHVILFETPDNHTDVYAHMETSVRGGFDHLTDPAEASVAHVLPKLFDTAGLNHGEKKLDYVIEP